MLKIIDLDRVAAIARKRSVSDRMRQHLRLAMDAAAARTRFRPRHALDHQIPQRPLRHGRRHRGRGRECRTARAHGVPAERRRRDPGSVRFIPRVARRQNTGIALGAPIGFGAAHRAVAGAASEGRARALSRASLPSAARPGVPADARIRGDDCCRDRRRSRGRAALPRTLPTVHAGREPRRRRKPDLAAGFDDARLDAARCARVPRHQRLVWCGCRSGSRTPTISLPTWPRRSVSRWRIAAGAGGGGAHAPGLCYR